MLVDGAEDRLANLTTGEMAELFDLLELVLVRVDAHRFEGTAYIPVPPDGGEIWKEGPQRPRADVPALPFTLTVVF